LSTKFIEIKYMTRAIPGDSIPYTVGCENFSDYVQVGETYVKGLGLVEHFSKVSLSSEINLSRMAEDA
jgi:hypothetical protein